VAPNEGIGSKTAVTPLNVSKQWKVQIQPPLPKNGRNEKDACSISEQWHDQYRRGRASRPPGNLGQPFFPTEALSSTYILSIERTHHPRKHEQVGHEFAMRCFLPASKIG
jgi:hypothetical protein